MIWYVDVGDSLCAREALVCALHLYNLVEIKHNKYQQPLVLHTEKIQLVQWLLSMKDQPFQ